MLIVEPGEQASSCFCIWHHKPCGAPPRLQQAGVQHGLHDGMPHIACVPGGREVRPLANLPDGLPQDHGEGRSRVCVLLAQLQDGGVPEDLVHPPLKAPRFPYVVVRPRALALALALRCKHIEQDIRYRGDAHNRAVRRPLHIGCGSEVFCRQWYDTLRQWWRQRPECSRAVRGLKECSQLCVRCSIGLLQVRQNSVEQILSPCIDEQ
mmetsp:Transcript_50877/g.146129  ORF Transcript_50877/g.146129 Transcript_50877/m.146129 type:complete len:208 (-) Transcript_50877:334-957(-)